MEQLLSARTHLGAISSRVGKNSRHSILSEKQFSIIVTEAVGLKMLRAQAGVLSGKKVFPAEASNPLLCQLRLTDWKPK